MLCKGHTTEENAMECDVRECVLSDINVLGKHTPAHTCVDCTKSRNCVSVVSFYDYIHSDN